MAAISTREIRYAMVGGGSGSFIGPVHRAALQMLSPRVRLVSAQFSSQKKTCDETARELGLELSRSYYDYREMAEREALLPKDQQPDFVVIVTPNHLHFPVAKSFMEMGFPIFCEKPLTKTAQEAEELLQIQRQKNLLFGVMYGYTGYPMVKEARRLIREGRIGKIRKVFVEYAQGWLTDPIEQDGQKQASWRTQASESGASLSMGDIGSHCENLLSYVTGLKIREISAHLASVVEGRTLDDDAMVCLKFDQGASGVLVASQILCGELNNLRIRVYGDRGAIRWAQMEPEKLEILEKDGSQIILSRGAGGLSPLSAVTSYLPSGHPEGLIEAFSNHYRGFIRQLLDREDSQIDFPNLEEGVRGMRFIERVVESSKSNQKWLSFS